MLRVAILGDAHYSTAGPRRSNLLIHRSAAILETVLRQITQRRDPPDFLIQIGDLIDGIDQTIDERRADLDNAVALIDATGVPWTWILGNHDLESFDGDRRPLLPYLRRDRTYAEMEIDGSVFLLLDSCLPAIHGHIDSAQRAWLEAALDRRRDRSLYVFVHHVFNWSVEDDMYIDNGEQIEALLIEARAVKAVFMGHSHTNRVDTIDGLHEITTGALCSWPLRFRWIEFHEDRIVTRTEAIDVSGEIREEARLALHDRPRPWRDQLDVEMTLKLRL